MLERISQHIPPMAAPAYMLKMKIGGTEFTEITKNIAPRLISLTVTDNRGLAADDLTLVLDDTDGQIEMPVRGATIKVSIGFKGEALTDVGEFTIDQVKHEGTPDKVTVTGRSVDLAGQLNTEREASWHDTTLGDIVKAIAERNNLKFSVSDSLAKIKIAHIDQTLESDASFLHRLAVRNGAALAFKQGKLMMVKPGQCKGPDDRGFSLVTITRSDGDQHSFEIADRVSYTGVVARWLDTKQPKKQTQQVQLQRKTTPPAEDAKQSAKGPAYTVGKPDNVYVISTVFPGPKEAEKAAEALWKKIQSNVANFSLTLAMGRTDITPETPVRVFGFKSVINDTPWVINKVTHMINNSGFVSKLELEIRIDEEQYDALRN